MAANYLTMAENYDVTAREIDFVSRFQLRWDQLINILGIMRPVRMTPGTVLKSRKATVTLNTASVGEGEAVPYSEAFVTEKDYDTITLEKYRKGVTLEAINKWGYEIAVSKTDEAFINELQSNVMKRFYTYLNTGELTNVQTSYQAALAMAQGLVIDKWESMQLSSTGVVGFGNILDLYDYLGSANVTVQTKFGFTYLKDFMGYNTFFLCPANIIQRGRVIATPIENIVLYYVSPSDRDFAKVGLNYRTIGATPLIGSYIKGDYEHVVSDNFVLMGLTMFSEYIDGIAVVDFASSGSLGSLTVTSVEGTEAGDTKLTVSETIADDQKLFYKTHASTAPSVEYLSTLDSTWKAFESGKDYTITDGHKVTVVAVNGTGQAVASGNTTADTKAASVG